ncbi:hypothetical protein [Thermogymnomonas acidicola]|uniref:hypothetical protein n=1 Tax=Thermogymnomonas acidicola TaxID=399579 RepID=UPI00149490A5|nr:hypothetical protein [Thermogymnomonas acidicola]
MGVRVLHFGTLDYGYAHSIQLRLLEGVSSGRVEGAIMFLEHPDVYTAGIHTSPRGPGGEPGGGGSQGREGGRLRDVPWPGPACDILHTEPD